MEARRNLLMKIIQAIMCVIDGYMSNNFIEDIYIDFGCLNVTKTSIIDIAYKRIDEIIARLFLDEEIYIARIFDCAISDEPIIIISTNPFRYEQIDKTVMKFKVVDSKVVLVYAN